MKTEITVNLDQYNQLLREHRAMREALEGVQHHNHGTKSTYQLPESLMRHIRTALAKAKGA